DVASATSDAAGSFSTTFAVPTLATSGEHTVTGSGQSSGLTASADFPDRTDWVKFHFDSANSGYNPYENVLDPSTVSSLSIKWNFLTGGAVYSTPSVVGGVVYAGSDDGKVYALDSDSGSKLWSFGTGSPVES